MTATAKQAATGPTVPPRRQRISVVTAGFGQNIVLTTVSTFMLVYLLQYAGISTEGLAVVTIIITVAKIVDAILDPVMGSLIDMTRTRWGKLRPYILFSAAPVAVLSALLFTVPDIAEPLKLVYFGVCYLLWGLAYAVCDVPFWGLIGSAFADPIERTRVIGNVRAFGAISLGLATLGMPWLAAAQLRPGDDERRMVARRVHHVVPRYGGVPARVLLHSRAGDLGRVHRAVVAPAPDHAVPEHAAADGAARLGARLRPVHRAGRRRGVRGHRLRRRGHVHPRRRGDHRWEWSSRRSSPRSCCATSPAAP